MRQIVYIYLSFSNWFFSVFASCSRLIWPQVCQFLDDSSISHVLQCDYAQIILSCCFTFCMVISE